VESAGKLFHKLTITGTIYCYRRKQTNNNSWPRRYSCRSCR